MSARFAAVRIGLLALMPTYAGSAGAQEIAVRKELDATATALAGAHLAFSEEPQKDQPGGDFPAEATTPRTLTRPVSPYQSFRPHHAVTFGLRNGTLVQTSGFGEALAPADETLQAQLGLSKGQGLVVIGVAPDSPAAKLGLKKDDILIALGENPLSSAADFDARVRSLKEAGPLTLIRAGKRITLNVEPEPTKADSRDEYYLGIPVGTVNDVLRAHLDVPAGQGLVVEGVQPDSPAARAGVERNDILLSVAGHPVADVKALRDRVRQSEGKPISLSVVRKSKLLTLEATPEKRKPAPGPAADYHPSSEPAGTTGPGNDPFGLYFVGPGIVLGEPAAGGPFAFRDPPKTAPNPTALGWVAYQPRTPTEESLTKRLDEVMKQLEATNRSLAELKAMLAKDGKVSGAVGGPRDR